MGVDISGDFTGTDPTSITPDHRGQLRMAYRLAKTAADQLMFVYGIGWHYWDGKRWAEDDRGMTTRAVLNVLRDTLLDSLTDKALRTDVRQCESAAGIRGVLEIASKLKTFAFTVTDLDADPYLLNVNNGTLDLHTMETRRHSPGDRITKVARAAYRPDVKSQAWQEFLDRVLPDHDVQGFLQRYLGVALCGTVLEHKLAILTGTGRNGKGVTYGAVNYALADYGGTAEPDLFMHREGAHPTGEMDLRGRRWVVVAESDQGRRLAEATVKRLTGGDEIKARRMRQDFVSFQPSHTAALVTNHLPRVSGDDPALWDRLRVVPFEVVIPKEEQDPHLPDKLRLEADAILTWAIRGWQDYQAGGLAEPDAVVTATDEYHLASNSVQRFVEDCCMVNPNMFVTVSDLWDRWSEWRVDDGAEDLSKKALGEALDKMGHPASKGTGGVRIRRGLGLYATDSGASNDR